MVFVLNTLKVDGKEYANKDIRRIVQLKEFGLDDSFYGGRVACIGRTYDRTNPKQESDLLLLLENKDGLQVIDLAVTRLDGLPVEIIRNLCKSRKIGCGNRRSKEDMIADLMGVKREKKEEPAA